MVSFCSQILGENSSTIPIAIETLLFRVKSTHSRFKYQNFTIIVLYDFDTLAPLQFSIPKKSLFFVL